MHNAARFHELDACRGIAAMTVVLAHLVLHYDGIFGFADFSFGAASNQALVEFVSRTPVYFFFMISGFVISQTLETKRSIGSFALSRFARLFPAYWTALTASSVILIIAPSVGAAPDASRYILNLTMLQNFFGGANVDPVYWSLAHELGFYALAAIFLVRPSYNNKRLFIFAIIWLSVSSAAFAISPAFASEAPALSQITQYTPYFVGGVCFYLWRAGERNGPLYALLVVAMIAAASRPSAAGPAGAVLVWMLFGAIAAGKAPWLACRPLLFLGKISYSLYLFHLIPGFWLIGTFDRLGAHPVLSVSIAVGLVVLCATAINHVVERPAQRAILKLRADRQPQRDRKSVNRALTVE